MWFIEAVGLLDALKRKCAKLGLQIGGFMAGSEATETKQQVPFVDYLILEELPYLQANECQSCKARFFDRRNACASCFGNDFKKVKVATSGQVTSFTIVEMGPVPYVSAIVDCEGTPVRCTLVGVEPTPEAVQLGMKVELTTYSMGTDTEGTEAIAFGFQPTK